jgi:hypothetical protein
MNAPAIMSLTNGPLDLVSNSDRLARETDDIRQSCVRDEITLEDFSEDDVTDAMIRAGEPYLLTFDPEKKSAWTVLPELFCAMLRANFAETESNNLET